MTDTSELIFDIFLGRLDGWHTRRAQAGGTVDDVAAWIDVGYKVETEHRIGLRLVEVYLIPACPTT